MSLICNTAHVIPIWNDLHYSSCVSLFFLPGEAEINDIIFLLPEDMRSGTCTSYLVSKRSWYIVNSVRFRLIVASRVTRMTWELLVSSSLAHVYWRSHQGVNVPQQWSCQLNRQACFAQWRFQPDTKWIRIHPPCDCVQKNYYYSNWNILDLFFVFLTVYYQEERIE